MLLSSGVAGRVFPGASCSMVWKAGTKVRDAAAVAGRLSSDSGAVEADTLYDLHDLTQVWTSTLGLMAAEGKIVDLARKVDELLPEIQGKGFQVPTIRDALEGAGRLPRWGALFLDLPHAPASAAAKRWMLVEAARRGDAPHEDTSHFSELAYLLAGEALARACDEHLGTLFQKWIAGPFGVSKDALNFNPPNQPRRRTLDVRKMAPTERCEWRGRIVVSESLDENATVFGGVAGHAGLFGTASAAAALGALWLDALAGKHSELPRKRVEEVRALVARKGLGYGWYHLKHEDSRVGDVLSPNSFGRTSITGSALWLDPERQLAIALLDNAIHPTRANRRIDGFLPDFFDRVIRLFDATHGED